MIIKKLVCGPLEANCYFICDDKEQEWALIDAPYPNAELVEFCEELGEKLKYILLTHCHWDHIAATNRIKAITNAKVAIHTNDLKGLTDSSISLSEILSGQKYHVEADIILSDGQKMNCGDLEIIVMHTPGHTSGSVCYVCQDVIFSGDILFANGSMGRIDFPTGNAKQMIASLRKLSEIEDNYTVYPGHYDKTDLEKERKYNPYM